MKGKGKSMEVYLKKIRLRNFKVFRDETIVFNKEINIFVGDNATGKSSILQAIDYVVTGSENRIEAVGLDNLFNVDAVSETNDRDGYTLGITSKTQCKIYIDKKLKKDLMYRTIIHELTHAYVWSYGFDQYTNFEEENLCDFIESYGQSILSKADWIFKKLFPPVAK